MDNVSRTKMESIVKKYCVQDEEDPDFYYFWEDIDTYGLCFEVILFRKGMVFIHILYENDKNEENRVPILKTNDYKVLQSFFDSREGIENF